MENKPSGYDVFLSHSSHDQASVRSLAERLRTDGLRVWLDEWEIRPGDSIPAKIEDGLERSRVLVLCISAKALGSDWALLESGTYRFRDPLNRERRFIPLRLDESPLTGSLSQFRFVSWLPGDREQQYPRLLESCRPQKEVSQEGPETSQGSGEEAIGLVLGETRGLLKEVAWTPEGRRALSGAGDGAVRLWDLNDGRCLGVLRGHTGAVLAATVSPGGHQALSAGNDRTVRLWDLDSKLCLQVFEGHTDAIQDVAWSPDGRRALSGAADGTLRLWDMDAGRCVRVIKSRSDVVFGVAWSTDGLQALTGGYDHAVRLWDLEVGRPVRVLTGHTKAVRTVAISHDGRSALSGGSDATVRLWDLATGRCVRVLEGHTDPVGCLAWSHDDRRAISGSTDRTVRLWDLESGRCTRVLKGHADAVRSLAWSPSGRQAMSGAQGGTVRLWDLSASSGVSLEPQPSMVALVGNLDQVQYTNAKVLLVGDSGSGKTGLTERVARGTFTASSSTSGVWSTQWQMEELHPEPGWDREVWLWDFGGQADQRPIHVIFMDNAALILLVFNADADSVLPSLQVWSQTLARSAPANASVYLVAGRTDVGSRFDRSRVREFAEEHGYGYFETSAKLGTGCEELRQAIQNGIPWDQLARSTSPTTWKVIRDQILVLRDEGQVLFTFKELRETLRHYLPEDGTFLDDDLERVVALLDSAGLVSDLGYGTYILLRPEWLNIYAQAVIRTLRAQEPNLGCLPPRSISEGKLLFQARSAGDEVEKPQRLGEREERTVLQAMERMLLERGLCLEQEGNLVFPSYCGVEKPIRPAQADPLVGYRFAGSTVDIYAALVVRLAHCGAFILTAVWRDAADFETLADHRVVSIRLLYGDDGLANLLIHFGAGVTLQEQVIFASYVHQHLNEKAEQTQRLRFYVCECGAGVKDGAEAMRRLEQMGKRATIVCQHCEKRIPLWDSLEERFADDDVRRKVEDLQAQERIVLDARRKGKLLALEVASRITSADQKCFEIPGVEDEGVDMEVEFTDDRGSGTGRRVLLQLKSGNSHLARRSGDGAEIFRIRHQRWVRYWAKQQCPVYLVVGTFAEDEEGRGEAQTRFVDIRWMEIGEVLRRETADGTKPVKQIVFTGERLDVMSVRSLRDRVLGSAQ